MIKDKTLAFLDFKLSERQLLVLELAISIVFVSLPLLVQLPFRDNLYVSWEGAYRMSIGQLPYQDFGIPVGPGMWLMPAIFFKLFGPYMISLVKAQAFLNLLSIISLRTILKAFNVKPEVILVSVLLFCLSYVMINFWPWYNQSVFIFQLIGTALLLSGLFTEGKTKRVLFIVLSAFFIVLSIFTKQDGGAMALFNAGLLLLVYCILQKRVLPIILFGASFAGFLALAIVPFLDNEIGYWFNYGQPPHYSRVSLLDLLNDWFLDSKWLKFFFLSALLLMFLHYRKAASTGFWNYLRENIHETLFNVFILGLLFQAGVIQVTSFSPPEGNYYFYTFGVAFLLHRLSLTQETSRIWIVGAGVMVIMIWWSDNYWKYTSKVFSKILSEGKDRKVEVSKYTWAEVDEDAAKYPLQLQHTWIASEFTAIKDMKLPPATLDGIRNLKKLDVWKKKDIRVLNMSELTFLAYEFGYTPEHSSRHPLWYHKHVGIFDREIQYLCEQIDKGTYDVVIFEPIPYLRDYFANEVQACAQQKYKMVMRFPAPKVDTKSSIEVYVKGE